MISRTDIGWNKLNHDAINTDIASRTDTDIEYLAACRAAGTVYVPGMTESEVAIAAVAAHADGHPEGEDSMKAQAAYKLLTDRLAAANRALLEAEEGEQGRTA